MRLGKWIFLFMCLFSSTLCFAEAPHRQHPKALEDKSGAIHTYGGGPLLEKVFNAVALILYGDAKTGLGKSFHGILRLSLAVGGFCAICLAFFREKFDPLLKSFFLPSLGIIGLLLIPRTSVLIIDHIGQKAPSAAVWGAKRVDNVPFFLGKFASLVSEVTYRLERLFTDRAHDIGDKMYDWTGNIYAGENIFRAKKCRISNPVLEDSFREFCRECVFRDLGIGLYTKDELVKSPNILKFLEDNTSNIRTVFYKDPAQTDSKDAPASQCLSCKEAMKRINQILNGKEGNAKEIIFGEIGNQVHFLLGQKELGEKELQNLIKQQIAIDVLKEEIPGNLGSFSAKRAEILQKENQKILGALGASSIVAMRNFFEAAIYMVFPLIAIVSLLSFGLKTIIQWAQFVLWINTWPLFYIVVNFLLNSIWDIRKKTVLGDSSHLTIFTSDGLSDLYSSMESIAAIALAFIPFLSWILLKGGVSQMVHLASSLTGPAQGAAATAAGEKTSGNYSFGNVSLDSISSDNAQMFRQTYSGMLSQGSVAVDTGSQTLSYTPLQDSLYLKQGDSYLREGISRSEAFSRSLQDSLSSSESAVQESSKAVSDGYTDSVNKGVGFVEAISKNLQVGENFNRQDMTSTQESFQYLKNISEEYAQSKGVSSDQALRELVSFGVGAGLPGKILGMKGDAQANFQGGVSKHSSDTESERSSETSMFQKHLQAVTNLSSGEVANVLGSEDARLHQDFVQSLTKTESAVDQWRAAYSKHEALSQVESHSSSDSLTMHQNLNQRFVDYLKDKYQGDVGKVVDATEMNNLDPRKRELVDEFVRDYLPGKISSVDLKEVHEQSLGALPHKADPESFVRQRDEFIGASKGKIGHDFRQIENEINHMASHTRENREETLKDLDGEIQMIEAGQFTGNRENVQQALEQTLMTHGGDKLHSLMPFAGIGHGLSSMWNRLFSPKSDLFNQKSDEMKKEEKHE